VPVDRGDPPALLGGVGDWDQELGARVMVPWSVTTLATLVGAVVNVEVRLWFVVLPSSK